MKTRLIFIAVLLVILAVIVSACGAAAAPTRAPAAAPTSAAARIVAATVVVMPPTAPARPAAAPATTQAVSKSGVSDVSASPYRESRMIVKNGDMNLLVADTDVAMDRAIGIAVDSGGYLISNKSWMQDGFKYATLSMGVPVDQFENAMRRMRGLAVQVLDENASGTDVSTEFVDLQSRMTNLEATAARIREFLKQAKDVNESLQVNAKLAEITAEIEQVKGRMTYLKDRAAFSTLTVNLQPQRPTPTPTLTPTVTPTPTAMPTPTPDVWRPDQTLNESVDVVVALFQFLGDVLIRVIVIGVPCGAPLVALLLIGRWISQRIRPQKVKPAPPQGPTGPA